MNDYDHLGFRRGKVRNMIRLCRFSRMREFFVVHESAFRPPEIFAAYLAAGGFDNGTEHGRIGCFGWRWRAGRFPPGRIAQSVRAHP